MKKIIKFLIFVLSIGFIFRVYKVNKNYPRDDMIKEYQINDEINYKNIQIKVTGFKLNNLKGPYEPRILDVYFDVKNSTDEDVNLTGILGSFIFYQNFSNSVMQNPIGKNEENSYKLEEMVLKANEEKNYTFKYMVEDYDMHRNNFLYIDNSLYEKQYRDYFNKGVLFYKVINLGDIYE